MCGIVGLVSKNLVNQDLYDALGLLQHRGQDAAGIVTCDGNSLYMRKGKGLVRDVFHTRHMLNLHGHMGIGHVRYPTAGTNTVVEAQPFYVNSPYGIVLGHNGNLINTEALKHELTTKDLRHINTGSDSEVLLNVFAHALQQSGKAQIDPDDIFHAVTQVHKRCIGAYAVVALIARYGVLGFRDPHGIRPMVYGKRETPNGTEYMMASENVALDVLGFKVIADVAPGEAIFITKEGKIFKKQCATETHYSPCIFEYVYLARPDSMIDKISVYKVRLRLGEHLADKILKEFPEHDIDVVMPIPDTSRTAASTLAVRLGVKYREGFVKNHYIGRTFIMPEQKLRQKSVRQKLNTLPLEFKDKVVLLVDDSIVRGTTSKEIVQMARDAGARKVYFASAAPPVKFPNVYGIDMPAADELIAHDKTPEEVSKLIGADWLIYQDLSMLVDACREGNANITRFEDSVFTGEYITGHVDETYLNLLQNKRQNSSREIIDETTDLM
ncbi:MAG: amidophosphoribosyltransferase [Gammaproteobacteria bacterium]